MYECNGFNERFQSLRSSRVYYACEYFHGGSFVGYFIIYFILHKDALNFRTVFVARGSLCVLFYLFGDCDVGLDKDYVYAVKTH